MSGRSGSWTGAALALALSAGLGVARAGATHGILDQASRLLDVPRIESLEYQASGRYYQFTQAPAPDLPWPPFDVDAYVATLDFARGAVHAKYHRVQVQEPGRARPPAEATMDQFAVDGVSWNLTPAATAMPGNVAERNAELWGSPQGFVRAALARQAKLRKDKDGWWARFEIGAFSYEGFLDRAGEVRQVRSWIDSAVLGDTLIEFHYADYRDFGGVRFPARIVRKVAGLPWYELSVDAVRVNTATAFEVPPGIAADPAPSTARVDISELAPGVWNFGGGSHNTVVVEQQGGLVVIEAPLGEERSLAVLAALRERFARRPIRAVINTHAHFDHAGGLRTFAAEGIPVITHERNAAYYARVWRQPHTLNPDRLAKSPRPPRFETFTDQLRLADAGHPVEIHAIQGSGHNDAFAMVYLPAQKLLVEADAWTPAPPAAAPPAIVNPLWVNLYDNVQRLHLDVERVAPLHGAVQDFATLRRAVGRQ